MNPFAFFKLIAAANEAEIEDAALIGVANASAGEAVFALQQDGRLFVPYGNFPHPRGLQLFNQEAAAIMARVFNSLPAKISRFFTGAGAPVYLGHPDVPGRPDSNPAAPAVGWIKGIAAENDGAYFDVDWNEDGQRAVTNKHFRFYSPNWNCRAVKGGIQPVQLLSIGLTNSPRIPVPAIANDENKQPTTMNPELLKLLGFAENDTPTDEQILAAITAHNDRLTALIAAENDLTIRVAEIADLVASVETHRQAAEAAVADLAAVRADLAAANDRFTAERAARVDGHLQGFTLSGHITGAERDTLRTELIALENDALTTRLTEIGKAKPKLPQNSIGEIGKTRAEFSASNDESIRKEQRLAAVDEQLTAIANDAAKAGLSASAKYDLAFTRARAKHPHLFPAKQATA